MVITTDDGCLECTGCGEVLPFAAIPTLYCRPKEVVSYYDTNDRPRRMIRDFVQTHQLCPEPHQGEVTMERGTMITDKRRFKEI